MTAHNTSDKQSNLASRAVKDVYPVSRLVREVRVLLEGSFPLIWVEGEISNLAMPASGHIYFTLKDEVAQVRCAMFRTRNQHLRFTPENGMQVLLRVRVTMYEGRGEFQLVAEHMEEAGSGALQRAYEALKHRLGTEGLFDSSRKKSLPHLPLTIGIVSSPNGAAVHDIISVLKRRFPAINIILYPVSVQGEGAAKQIAEAIKLAEQRNECELLIIGRGGGSLEDLWSFNDESLARVIANCQLPTISAVGHEIDFTIADFVADVRAPTPSAAAEIAVPEVSQLIVNVASYKQTLTNLIKQRCHREHRHIDYLKQRLPKPATAIKQQLVLIAQRRKQLDFAWRSKFNQSVKQLDYLAARMKHPQATITMQKERLEQFQDRMHKAMSHSLKQNIQLNQNLKKRLMLKLPSQKLQLMQQHLNGLESQLNRQIETRINSERTRLAQQVRTLSAISPLNTLDRGYSITRESESNKVITQASQTRCGQLLKVNLAKGELLCEVKNVIEK